MNRWVKVSICPACASFFLACFRNEPLISNVEIRM